MRSQINEEITFRKLEILLAYMEGGNLNSAAEKLTSLWIYHLFSARLVQTV